MTRFDFASDNVAGAMPEVMGALERLNTGYAAAYGEDATSARAGDLVRELLDVDADVSFVASGTAANALTLAALAAPHEAILAHEHSHVATDETGAPGFFGGGVGVIPLRGASGRIEQASLAEALAKADDPHWQAPAALSITQTTEFGTVYASASIADLAAAARAYGAKLHLDGARVANAIAAGFDAREIGRLGFDIVVLGGTKAGSTPSEAIVVLETGLRRRWAARLKHTGQLVSKARHFASPWVGLLEDRAWIRRAAHANTMARRLAGLMPFPIAHPVESNAVFARMDAEALARLRAAGWFVYRMIDGSVRFMCSWATTPEAVDELGDVLDRLPPAL